MNQKQQNFLKIVGVAVIFVMVISSINKCVKRSSVLVQGLPEAIVYFNENGKELKTGDTTKDGYTKLKQKLEPGSYVLFYKEDERTRYYGTLRIRKNEKKAKINFRRQRLPAISRKLELKSPEDIELGSSMKRYFIYLKNGNTIDYNAEINMSVRGSHDGLDKEFVFKWLLNIDGSRVSKEEIILSEDSDEKLVIWQDNYHFYEVSYNLKNNLAELSIQAKYKE